MEGEENEKKDVINFYNNNDDFGKYDSFCEFPENILKWEKIFN